MDDTGELLENNPLSETEEYWMETIFLEVQNEVEVSRIYSLLDVRSKQM